MSEDYGKLAIVSFNNAMDLMKESKILYEQNHFSRSYILAILAAEELTKAMACKNVWSGKASQSDLFKTNKKGTKKQYYLKDYRIKHFIFHRALIIRYSYRQDRKKLIETLPNDPLAKLAEERLPEEVFQRAKRNFQSHGKRQIRCDLLEY